MKRKQFYLIMIVIIILVAILAGFYYYQSRKFFFGSDCFKKQQDSCEIVYKIDLNHNIFEKFKIPEFGYECQFVSACPSVPGMNIDCDLSYYKAICKK
jgi:hypothetical protein